MNQIQVINGLAWTLPAALFIRYVA
jgi:hypothetical protein